jgi:hypothetical protein
MMYDVHESILGFMYFVWWDESEKTRDWDALIYCQKLIRHMDRKLEALGL